MRRVPLIFGESKSKSRKLDDKTDVGEPIVNLLSVFPYSDLGIASMESGDPCIWRCKLLDARIGVLGAADTTGI